MIHLVTYASENMSKSAELCKQSALKNGVDLAFYYNDDLFCYHDGLDSFGSFNVEILNSERGAGYWLWKPFVIYWHMISHCKENDILIYSDAGVEFVNNVSHIIDKMDEDIFFFTNGWPHVEWCKGDVIDSINHYDMDDVECFIHYGIEYSKIKQIQASVIFFRVNQKIKDFVKEWLLYCQMPGFIDDSPSKLPNYPTFAEHRHDQAILTCLAIKHGYTIDHWWPTQYSYHLPRSERDGYPVMFNHHRKRNNEW